MRYRKFLPHNHLILDVLNTAVLLTYFGLTLSLFIQALVDSGFIPGHIPASNRLGLGMPLVSLARAGFYGLRARLLARLSRRIHAETVDNYHHRSPRGLPFSVDSSTLYFAANLVAIAAVVSYFMRLDVPAPKIVFPHSSPVPILSDLNGRIETVYVREGSSVRLGDPLVQLDTRELRLKKNAVEWQIHLAELRVPDRRPDLNGLYNELQQLQLELGRYTITSPVDGLVVTLAPLKPNEKLRAGQAFAVVVDLALN